MPCDTVTTQSVNLAHAIPDLLAEALTGLGWKIIDQITGPLTGQIMAQNGYYNRLTWTRGKGLEVSGSASQANETIRTVTRAYSEKAVSWAAQRAGWKVTNNGTGLQVTRR